MSRSTSARSWPLWTAAGIVVGAALIVGALAVGRQESAPSASQWRTDGDVKDRERAPSRTAPNDLGRQPATSADSEAGRLAWLRANGASPVEYVASLFGAADLVIIGETHEIADNCEFVASLLRPIYRRAGVRVLATEFLKSSLNRRVESIVMAAGWDDQAAVDLFRDGPWPTWGFREYVDIIKAAWELNRSLPKGAEPIRVVGMDAEWRQIDLMSSGRVERFHSAVERETHMHGVVGGLVEGPGKVLVHAGFAHSLFVGGHRLGAMLRKDHGQRVQHLILHREFATSTGKSAVTASLDWTFSALGAGPIAFRMAGSPFGDLGDPDATYAKVLGPEARLNSLIEHYAILAPTRELRPVRWIPGFIEGERLEEAIRIGEQLRWIDRGVVRTRAEANRAFAERLEARRP